MSDLFETREKTEKGSEWRGEIAVSVDGEQQTLCVRQLCDTEFWEVMSLIDTDELSQLDEELPEEDMEEYKELTEKDELSQEEQERLDALESDLEQNETNMFDIVSTETFEGIRKAAKYAVEPDADDKREALIEYGSEIEEQFGRATEEEAAKYVNRNVIEPMIDDSTGFTSFAIGVKALTETMDDEGNLES